MQIFGNTKSIYFGKTPSSEWSDRGGKQNHFIRDEKRLDETKGLWVEYLHEILWSCHTTPRSTTYKTPFRTIYGADAMTPIVINTLT